MILDSRLTVVPEEMVLSGYKSLQAENYKVGSSYWSRKVLQQLSEGRRFGKMLSCVLETDTYLKGVTECSVCNYMPSFSLSYFWKQTHLGECSWLSYSHLFWFLKQYTFISVTSRIKNMQRPRSVDLSSKVHSCLAFWSNGQGFFLNFLQNCKTLATTAVAVVYFIFSLCLQNFHATWILNFLKKILFMLAKCWCLGVKEIKKESLK